MKNIRRMKLKGDGWHVGDAADFLLLEPDEVLLIEVRYQLGRTLRSRRSGMELTQHMLAARLGSSQSRVAKMEAGDPSVSLDLLIRALLQLGVSVRDIGRAIANAA